MESRLNIRKHKRTHEILPGIYTFADMKDTAFYAPFVLLPDGTAVSVIYEMFINREHTKYPGGRQQVTAAEQCHIAAVLLRAMSLSELKAGMERQVEDIARYSCLGQWKPDHECHPEFRDVNHW